MPGNYEIGFPSSVQFSSLVTSDSLQHHGPRHARPPCPSPTPGVYPNLYPLSQWCHPTISSSVIPFSSCPQSFPAWGFFPELVLHIRWPNYWSFSFSISPSNEYSGLISFRIWLVGSPCSPRDSQESSPTPQFKSISSSVLIFLYSPTLTSIHDYWKDHSFDWSDFVSKVMSLLFNVLSRLVIAFIPRKKHLLISWL